LKVLLCGDELSTRTPDSHGVERMGGQDAEIGLRVLEMLHAAMYRVKRLHHLHASERSRRANAEQDDDGDNHGDDACMLASFRSRAVISRSIGVFTLGVAPLPS
jgi:hypothetical protein